MFAPPHRHRHLNRHYLSEAKTTQIEKLSHLVTGVTYTAHPDISAKVKRVTNGMKVDLVVSNVGPNSIPSENPHRWDSLMAPQQSGIRASLCSASC